jgi:PAS domain-containing protein
MALRQDHSQTHAPPAKAVSLIRQLRVGEDWLVQRVLHYARCRGFTRYTPTLEEAWRKTIRELIKALDAGLAFHAGAPELDPHAELERDPLGRFAAAMARSHQDRGVDLPMYLGLFKYYRLAFAELAEQQLGQAEGFEELRAALHRLFDRIEQALCEAWTRASNTEQIDDLKSRNRTITNEKNAYLTVFESLSHAAFLLDERGRVRNLNHEAMRMLGGLDRPGSAYYALDDEARSSPDLVEEVEAAATRAPE